MNMSAMMKYSTSGSVYNIYSPISFVNNQNVFRGKSILWDNVTSHASTEETSCSCIHLREDTYT